MAKKQVFEKGIDEIIKVLKSDEIVIGADRTIKKIKTGKIRKVFVTSNCNKETVKAIEHYSKISGVELAKLDALNKELGTICKKPFAISVIGILKAGEKKK